MIGPAGVERDRRDSILGEHVADEAVVVAGVGKLHRVAVLRKRLGERDVISFRDAVARAAREFEAIAVVEQNAVRQAIAETQARHARVAIVAGEDQSRSAMVVDEADIVDIDIVASHPHYAGAEVADLEARDLDAMAVVNREARAVVTAHVGPCAADPARDPNAAREIVSVRRTRASRRGARRDELRAIEHYRWRASGLAGSQR